MLWSNIYLFIRGRGGPAEGFGLEVSPRTSKLVASGPYRYTRNPMVFGAFCLYISITLMLNSPSGLLGLCILLLLVFLYLKISEEKRLSRDFGEEWIKYKKKTPMIFPCKFQRAGT
ncbi:isoprenylcysteine carboxylmethyltransferase family protein [candidate division WOR-3 bacterium]|nr:isoprenylcysteine carboxylmethyltransferase family protein [candidate division WOR-3 bacterium]